MAVLPNIGEATPGSGMSARCPNYEKLLFSMYTQSMEDTLRLCKEPVSHQTPTIFLKREQFTGHSGRKKEGALTSCPPLVLTQVLLSVRAGLSVLNCSSCLQHPWLGFC